MSSRERPGRPQPTGQKTLDSYFSRHAHEQSRPRASPLASPNTMRPSFQSANSHNQPESPGIAIVLSRSPAFKASSYVQHDNEEGQDDAPPDKLISDLSPQFRRLAAQAAQPVSLSKPVMPEELPDAYGDGGEDELTKPPRKARQAKLNRPLYTQPELDVTSEQTVKKKPGRPKGYRPSFHKGVGGDGKAVKGGKASAKKAAAAAASSAGTRRRGAEKPAGTYYTGKRRGRPPKPPPKKPREVYEGLDPNFMRFICEWEGCRAELHNLETLRKHIVVVHTKKQLQQQRQRQEAGATGGMDVDSGTDVNQAHSLKCRWRKCATRQPPQRFDTLDGLTAHIEQVHVPLVQWQAGDGPNISMTAYRKETAEETASIPLPDYLFNNAGEQVTPSVREQKEEDLLTWRENRRKLKALLLSRDQNLPDEDEENSQPEK